MVIGRDIFAEGIIVAIDADNLLITSAKKGVEFKNYDLMAGFEKMFSWMDFGKIICVNVYLPSWQIYSKNDLWHDLWQKYRKEFPFKYVYCPKKKPANRWEKKDNVDAHLIADTKELVKLYARQAKYFCLASGDKDYSPLVWDLKRENDIQIAFAVGSEDSFSNTYRQAKTIAKHPVTGLELVHYFSPHK